MSKTEKKKLFLIGILSVLLAGAVFVSEQLGVEGEPIITRNGYGKGSKTEVYELTIPGKIEQETVQIETSERLYTHEEIQAIFTEVMDRLDGIILGENESFDRVEQSLNLVTEDTEYPIQIRWELSSYDVMNTEGEIAESRVSEEGTLVELRGTLSYYEEEAVYVRNVMVYPVTRVGAELILHEVKEAIRVAEEESRREESFVLPIEVSGRKLQWSRKKEQRWLYVLLLGAVCCVFLVYRSREKVRQAEKLRRDELARDYPGMISKFTMLLQTGVTVKQAWEKIVEHYERQRDELGVHVVYEEMGKTLREIQSGVAEAESYERFGKRCGVTVYLKFGALLSQNLRKGSRGISELLRMEAIQSFEDRKSTAKRLGEEAGTKLLLPMLGMLAVVFIMVMVPAFLSLQG